MSEIITVGLHLTKNVIQAHGAVSVSWPPPSQFLSELRVRV